MSAVTIGDCQLSPTLINSHPRLTRPLHEIRLALEKS